MSFMWEYCRRASAAGCRAANRFVYNRSLNRRIKIPKGEEDGDDEEKTSKWTDKIQELLALWVDAKTGRQIQGTGRDLIMHNQVFNIYEKCCAFVPP